jgi:sugar-specific transcriptional regulator TrmB
MSDNPDEKKFKFNLPAPPPPPPSIEDIKKGMQAKASSQMAPPSGPPGARHEIAPLSPPPEPPAVQAMPQAAYAPNAMAGTLQQETFQLKQALVQARQTIEVKEGEIAAFNSSFKDIQVQLAQVSDMLKAKDSEIEGLRSSFEMLTIEAKNKDNAVLRSKAKIDLLEESTSRSKHEVMAFQKKAEELQKENEKIAGGLQAVTKEKADLQAKLDEISKTSQAEAENLRAEKLQINDRLLKRIAEVEEQEKKMLALQDEITTLKHKLGVEIESKRELESKPDTSTARIINGRGSIIKLFNELLDNAIHSVMIVVPAIKDLQELDLMKLKPSVKVLLSVKVDMKSQAELDFVQELQKLTKIELRSFDNEDRFGINIDRGVVFIGVNSKQPFGLVTEDQTAIALFVKQFMIETWTLGRQINVRR